jgi:transcriptional regulator with XRE-family HTH domain
MRRTALLTPERPEAPSERGVRLPYLRQWREYRLYSMEHLARESRSSVATLLRAEHGGLVRFATVRKLARHLAVDPETLAHQAPPTTN